MKHAAMVSFSLFLTCHFIFIQSLYFTDVTTSREKKLIYFTFLLNITFI